MGKMFRVTRALKYLSLFIAGVITMVTPSAIVEGGIGPHWAIVWSIMLCLGSLVAAYGTLRKNWTGEYIGLPAVISCLFLYAMVCFLDVSSFTLLRLFIGMIFMGFTFSTLARRSDVKFQKRLADFENRRKNGLPGL